MSIRGEGPARVRRRRPNGGGVNLEQPSKTVLICSCEDTMPLDVAAIRRGCPNSEVKSFRHLCGAELDHFRKLAAAEGVLTVACTQQAAQFSDEAGERPDAISFVNIRETAGWSRDGARTGAKMAALLASAAVPSPDYPLVTLSSEGVILIYGRDEAAIEAGRLLADHLDVTVMLKQLDDTVPPAIAVFRSCRARSAPRRDISAHLSLRSTTMRVPVPPRAIASCWTRREAASPRAAMSSSTCPALCRCFLPTTCATAICAPTRRIPLQCSAPC